MFNLNRYTRELYEENFCYLFPCYEIRFEMRRPIVVSRIELLRFSCSIWKLLSSEGNAAATQRFPRRTPNSSQRPEPQLMNCLLLSRYGRLGASSRMRFYQYLPFLESQRIHVETAALLDDSYIRNLNSGNSTDWASILGSYLKRVRSLARSRRFDLVWVEAEVFPWLPDWGELWLSWRHIPYVVDYDDAAFHRYDLHSLAAVRWLLGHKIDRVMKRAALVVAGNSYLADRARQAGAGPC